MSYRMGGYYVDRGDPSAWDFSLGDFTADGDWYDLDLSSIVPVGTTHVNVKATIQSDTVGTYISFRQKGNVNNFNQLFFRTQVANTTIDGDYIVAVNSNRYIQYRLSASGTYARADVLISGWFI